MEKEILKVFEKRMEGYSNKKSIYRQVRLYVAELKPEAKTTAFAMAAEGLLQYHGYGETFRPYFQLKKKGFEQL